MNNEELLERIHEDILDDIICEGDIVKVIRGVYDKSLGHAAISNYYYDDDECDEDYEEMTVALLINELRSN